VHLRRVTGKRTIHVEPPASSVKTHSINARTSSKELKVVA
jgi:hypothetical protein